MIQMPRPFTGISLNSLLSGYLYNRHVLPVFLVLAAITCLAPSTLFSQFSFRTFNSTEPFCLQQDARLVGDRILLARNIRDRVGALWYNQKQPVSNGFTTRFSFQMGKEGDLQEADGIAFVIQNTDACTFGSLAQGIGYEGIPNSLAVEFDSWYNEEYDPDNNHVSVQTNGLYANHGGADASLGITSNVPDLGLGDVRVVVIDYRDSLLRVYIDDCAVPVLEVHVVLDSVLNLDNGTAWVGLTSATGDHYQDHYVYSWEFQSDKRHFVRECEGESAILEGPEGFPRYLWSTGDTTRVITVDSSGTYTLFVDDWFLCSDAEPQFSYDVTLNPDPFVPRIYPPGPFTICPGDSIEVGVLTGGYRVNEFIWSTGSRSASVVLKESGKYHVTLVDNNGCVYNSDVVQVSVLPEPKPIILPSDPVFICDGDSLQLWVAAWFDEYAWSTGSTDSIAIVREPGIYTLAVVDFKGCKGYDTIEVFPMEEGVFTSNDTAVCAGSSAQLRAVGRMEYTWFPADGLSCVDCPNPVATPLRTTSYIVRGSNNDECVIYDTVTVTILDPPVSNAGNDTTICSGDRIPLRGSGGVEYLWSPAVNISCLTCPDPLVAPDSTTTYYLHVKSAAGCENVDSVVVTVEDPGALLVRRDTSVCPGSVVQLRAEGTSTYRWFPSEGLSCVDCPNPIAAANTTTTWYVVGTNASGKCSSLDSVRVEVFDPPIANAGQDAAICTDESLRLKGSGGGVYRWDDSPDLSCFSCADPIARPTQTTTYYLTVTDNNGCVDRDSVTVVVYPDFDVAVSQDTTVCFGDPLTLQATGGVRWLWEPANGLSCTDCPNPVCEPTQTTTYQLTAWSADGCERVDSVVVGVQQEPEVIRLRVGREYRALTGSNLVIPIELVGQLAESDVRDIDLQLRYNPSVMLVEKGSLQKHVAGTMLDGWNLEIVRSLPGELQARIAAPANTTLSGSGDLLRFEGRLYLSSVYGTELQVELRTESNCYGFSIDPGYAQVDSICGLNFRLIDLSTNKYVAPTAWPNPAHERVTLEFGIGLPGHVRFQVFDEEGRSVGVLVDEDLEAGVYNVEWDVRRLPASTYWYRIKSGDWTKTGRVLVLK